MNKLSGTKRETVLPLRYGGEYSIKGGNQDMAWLHCSGTLRDAHIGSPLSANNPSGVWKCTPEEASSAIAEGSAAPNDFMVVSGLSVWTKGKKGMSRGMEGEIKAGNFEIIPKNKLSDVFNALLRQEVLSSETLQTNLDICNEAWNLGADSSKVTESSEDDLILDGIGDEFDEENDSTVFQSNEKLDALSDKALRNWVATFLLGEPSLDQ